MLDYRMMQKGLPMTKSFWERVSHSKWMSENKARTGYVIWARPRGEEQWCQVRMPEPYRGTERQRDTLIHPSPLSLFSEGWCIYCSAQQDGALQVFFFPCHATALLQEGKKGEGDGFFSFLGASAKWELQNPGLADGIGSVMGLCFLRVASSARLSFSN